MTQGPSGPDRDGDGDGDAATMPEHPTEGSGPDPREDDPDARVSPAPASSRRGLGGLHRLRREARIGLAILLSFLILVTVLVINKGKSTSRSGKLPPVAKIDPPESSPSPSPPAKPREHPGKEGERVVSESPPIPPPVETVTATEPSGPVVPQPLAPKVPEPVADPVQLTGAEHEPVAPPPPSEETTGATPVDSLQANGTEGEAPVHAPGLDLPPGPMPSMASESPAPPPDPVEMPPVPAPVAVSPPAETGPQPPITESPGNLDGPSATPDTSLVQTPIPPPADPELPPAGAGDMVAPEEVPPLTPVPPSSARKPDPGLAAQPSQSSMEMEKESPAPPAQPRKKAPRSPDPVASGRPDSAPDGSPSPAPGATVSLPSTTSRHTGEVPGPTASAERFEPEVAPAPTENPFADQAGGAGAGQGKWIALPNSATSLAGPNDAATRGTADGPPVARTGVSDRGAGDLVDPMPHVVQSGENFWTISRLYYGSGRFYKALWKANSGQVAAPEKLRVGQTIRIPPPEALDRSLVLPPRPTSATDAAPSMHRASRPVLDDSGAARASEVELALPVTDPFADRPGVPETSGGFAGTVDRPRRLIYKVRPHETLRSIARDTLGDSRRAGEILELNRDLIDDPNHPTPGQLIDLPGDARLARRVR